MRRRGEQIRGHETSSIVARFRNYRQDDTQHACHDMYANNRQCNATSLPRYQSRLSRLTSHTGPAAQALTLPVHSAVQSRLTSHGARSTGPHPPVPLTNQSCLVSPPTPPTAHTPLPPDTVTPHTTHPTTARCWTGDTMANTPLACPYALLLLAASPQSNAAHRGGPRGLRRSSACAGRPLPALKAKLSRPRP